MLRASVLWVLVTGSACVPFPHLQQRTPLMTGVLTEHGVPVAGVPVRWVPGPDLNTQLQCDAGEVRATTDVEGRFSVPATRDFEFFVMFGDRLDTWGLCFQLPDGRTTQWLGSGWWGGPKQVDLSCHVERGTCEQR